MGDWILITSEDLPALPHVANKVLSAVSDPASSAKTLQSIIETDQALAGRLLRMANSAMFAGTRETTTLQAAVARLGFNRVRNLVLIAATRDVLRSKNKTAEELWKHALGVGLASRMVGETLRLPPGAVDDLFLAGLFHDVGKVLMNNQKPERYLQIIQTALEQRRPTSEVEKEVFQFSHEEVGAMIVTKWKLPEFLVNPVRYHHLIQDERNKDIPSEKNVAAVATADLIANMIGIGLLTSATIAPVNVRSSRLLRLEQEQILPIAENLPDVYLSHANYFE
ncbi:MAG: HDOD domain-containing protein [Planctomycetes bacterium]|nr:HDOD domain-containing protein [Planctomycetota bacterium]